MGCYAGPAASDLRASGGLANGDDGSGDSSTKPATEGLILPESVTTGAIKKYPGR
ncbi:MAG: hypothetical protein L0H38_01415 [bacterium]|nr:hypothetical protein [bacterium]